MAAGLPDGAKVFLATSYSSSKSVSAVTNADPAKVTATGHSFDDGDYVVLISGWQGLNERVFKIDNKATNDFELVETDTTDTDMFPATEGVGSAVKINTWQQITQVVNFSMTGGDQQYATFSFLEEDFERQLPTVVSARSIEMGIADDPTQLGFQALAALEGKKMTRALRLALPSGSELLYNGVLAFNSTPSLTKGEVMVVTATFSLQGAPTRIL